MWTADEVWRAPVGDFPPPWASAWGDDPYGLWADLMVNGVTQRMRWIEPSGLDGFLMGAEAYEHVLISGRSVKAWADRVESSARQELVMRGFWLADTPCTQEFWRAVDGASPSHFVNGSTASGRPVEQVCMVDIEVFLEKLNRICSLGERARLPSEIEWEYCARAGSSTPYWWGREFSVERCNVNAFDDRDWSQQDAGTSSVNAYEPNHWGVYDMLGNVWEWTADHWIERLDASDLVPDINSFAVRGGSWIDRPGDARCASRNFRNMLVRKRDLGFRFLVALSTVSALP